MIRTIGKLLLIAVAGSALRAYDWCREAENAPWVLAGIGASVIVWVIW